MVGGDGIETHIRFETEEEMITKLIDKILTEFIKENKNTKYLLFEKFLLKYEYEVRYIIGRDYNEDLNPESEGYKNLNRLYNIKTRSIRINDYLK
jgi:hypothetical protein